MLIAVTGSHSVGKTVLVDNLRKKLSLKYDVSIIHEMARKLIAKGFKMNMDITEYGVINYAFEYLHAERNFHSEIVISDRSVIDLLAYIKVNKSPKIKPKVISLIEEIVFLESRRVDFYFYIPIEFPLQFDGVRPADLNYQKSVDKMIQELLSYYKIKNYKITGTISKRVTKATKIINDFYKSI